MKTNYVSLDNVIHEFVEDIGFDLDHGEIPEATLRRWANDCLRWINSEEQLAHRITILQVENTRAKLPEDFKYLAQAAAYDWHEHDPCDCEKDPNQQCCDEAYRSHSTCPDCHDHPHHHGHDHHPHDIHHGHHHHGYGPYHYPYDKEFPYKYPKSRREDIIQWTQSAFQEECDLEINLICPTCKTSNCSCSSPVVEVDVDRIWEQAHPEIYYRNYNKIGRVGYGPGPGSPSSFYNPKFKLMRYALNNYFNVQNIVTHCPNVDCTNCTHEFMLNLPYIEVDFKRGEVLISYLGTQMDDHGDLLVPDHPSVFAALNYHLQYKWFNRLYLRSSDPSAGQKAQAAMQKREQEIGMANSALNMPDFSQFYSWMEQNLIRRVPDYNHHMNMNKTTLDPNVRYNDILNGRRHLLRRHRK